MISKTLFCNQKRPLSTFEKHVNEQSTDLTIKTILWGWSLKGYKFLIHSLYIPYTCHLERHIIEPARHL